MIISRTPFRVSFAGGGTDLESYYKTGFGCVVSTTIQDYMYVNVNRKFDDQIRVSYSETEFADSVEKIKHELVREAMRQTGVVSSIEVVTIADIPGRGTGLGSSSSLAVGLLNALYAFKGIHRSAKALAEEACTIEIETLRQPIGKQDQYAAAYGGFNYIQFNADGSVFIDPIIFSASTRRELVANLLLFYTGLSRRSESILKEQDAGTDRNRKVLDEMRDQAMALRDHLIANDLTSFGEILHQGWELKKNLAQGVTNRALDEMYERARAAGAIGGKVLGAGGGGFLLLYAEPGAQPRIRTALSHLKECPFRLEPQGSKIIYFEGEET